MSITFDEESHIYKKGDIEYISVTQLIKLYTPHWDPKGIRTAESASRYCKECKEVSKSRNGICEKGHEIEGITPREMVEIWDIKAKESTDFGTFMHESFDKMLKTGIDSNNDEVNKFIDEKRKVYYASEYIVWDDDLKIAGTIDLLTKDKYGNLIIEDWKTNGKPIEIDNKYNKYLLAPLESIPNNNYYKYALQLSLYRYILERQGKKVNSIKLIHLYNGFKEIELPYLKSEIEAMLKHYKEMMTARLPAKV